MKTDSLSARYEAVSQSHSERFSALEQAQVLVARFWETHEDLDPWLGETEALISQLPPPAIDTEALRQQQEQMRVRRTLTQSRYWSYSIILVCETSTNVATADMYY